MDKTKKNLYLKGSVSKRTWNFKFGKAFAGLPFSSRGVYLKVKAESVALVIAFWAAQYKIGRFILVDGEMQTVNELQHSKLLDSIKLPKNSTIKFFGSKISELKPNYKSRALAQKRVSIKP